MQSSCSSSSKRRRRWHANLSRRGQRCRHRPLALPRRMASVGAPSLAAAGLRPCPMEQPLSPGLTTGETENEPVLAPKGTHSCLDILCHPRIERTLSFVWPCEFSLMCRAPRKAVPISLVSDSTTPRGGKRGPSTLCVPRNQAHVNGGSGLAQNGEGGPGAKAGTPKLAGGPFGGTGGDSGMTWSPSSAPTTPSGKGDMVSGLPFSQVQASVSLCNTILRGHLPMQASKQPMA